MVFEQHWPRGFRGGHLKLSTVFPFKCMGPIQMHTEANLTEIINSFSIQMYGAHTNAYRSKFDLAIKRSNHNIRPSF